MKIRKKIQSIDDFIIYGLKENYFIIYAVILLFSIGLFCLFIHLWMSGSFNSVGFLIAVISLLLVVIGIKIYFESQSKIKKRIPTRDIEVSNIKLKKNDTRL